MKNWIFINVRYQVLLRVAIRQIAAINHRWKIKSSRSVRGRKKNAVHLASPLTRKTLTFHCHDAAPIKNYLRMVSERWHRLRDIHTVLATAKRVPIRQRTVVCKVTLVSIQRIQQCLLSTSRIQMHRNHLQRLVTTRKMARTNCQVLTVQRVRQVRIVRTVRRWPVPHPVQKFWTLLKVR